MLPFQRICLSFTQLRRCVYGLTRNYRMCVHFFIIKDREGVVLIKLGVGYRHIFYLKMDIFKIKLVIDYCYRIKVKSCYNPLRLGTVIVLVSSGIGFVNTPLLYSDRATR